MNMKGSLPMLILTILARGPSHGYRIVRTIHEQSGGMLDFKEGTLYPALHALESNGMVEGYEAEENGRTRRYYKITERGRGELAKSREQWQQYVESVNLVLEGVSS
jgi:transcriptional regulator